jgi:protein-L-isoaspartate(D-aspartate) O-methyltransferase
MGEVPRERFLPERQRSAAYHDQALPLAEGQTISQPYMVAVMTEALELETNHRVLEIGTGSGYQTAILSRLAGAVFTVERLPGLSRRARSVLAELGCQNVQFRVGDGSVGWREEEPFEAILVTAGAPSVPESLKAQLHPEGGRLVIPVGDRFVQDLLVLTRSGSRFAARQVLSCRFVPLLGGEGWESPGS